MYMYFFFCVKTKEKDTKKKKSRLHFLATLFLRSAKEKELANAQTAFSF